MAGYITIAFYETNFVKIQNCIKLTLTMIQFNNPCQETPYIVFKEKYNESLSANQKNIEAICISSYLPKSKEVNARFVNLKYVNEREFIFFSNYNSPKSKDFDSHGQITALIYWNSINVQIRIKAKIQRTSKIFNQAYFAKRDKKKNALAISSDQSNTIKSYNTVKKNYELVFNNENLLECPEYWGGFSFVPYYFEFWQGHHSRLNKRSEYTFHNNEWVHNYLQP